MRRIEIPVQEMNAKGAALLASRGLVHFLRHPGTKLRNRLHQDFYKEGDFPARFHSLHSVTITYTEIRLAYHPRGFDEIVMLWDPEPRVKPLYFVFSLLQAEEYLKKLDEGTVTSEDYLAFRAPMNHPQWGAFIVWNRTVHCELTNSVGDFLFPSFYVLEPDPLEVVRTEEHRYGLQLSLSSQ